MHRYMSYIQAFYPPLTAWQYSLRTLYTAVPWLKTFSKKQISFWRTCLVGEGSLERFSSVFPCIRAPGLLFTVCSRRSCEHSLSGLARGFDPVRCLLTFLSPVDRIRWCRLNASLPNRSAFALGLLLVLNIFFFFCCNSAKILFIYDKLM